MDLRMLPCSHAIVGTLSCETFKTFRSPDCVAGGSHEGYIKWACAAAASRGWRAVVLNMRGCNGLPLTSARGYNAINTGDVHVAVQSIRRYSKGHDSSSTSATAAAGFQTCLMTSCCSTASSLYQYSHQHSHQHSNARVEQQYNSPPWVLPGSADVVTLHLVVAWAVYVA